MAQSGSSGVALQQNDGPGARSRATSLDELFSQTAERAIAEFEGLQPWPSQFRRRALEMLVLSRLHDLSAGKRMLELGCGNAFGSALLAEGRERVVATDLPSIDVKTHSIGLKKARNLLDALGHPQCDVVGASAERLPFADRSFDLVFSLFVLEHVPRREACLREIRRVLSDGGVTVHAVPGMMWSVTAPLRFHLYLAQRALFRLRRRRPDDSTPTQLAEFEADNPGSPVPARNLSALWRLFRTRYPQFPLPPPHGEYKNYFDETVRWTRRQWVELFERNGFEVLDCQPTMILPLDTMTLLLGKRGFALYERLFSFDQWLARRAGLRGFGQFYGIVARRVD